MAYTPMQLAEAFIQTGEFDDALDALNQHLQTEPGDDSARRMRIVVLLQLNGTDQLRLALEDSDQLQTPSADDLMRRSIILERLADLAGALQSMKTARALAPENERLVEREVHLLLAQNRLAEARTLVESQPQTWRWMQWAGDLAARDGDHAAAVERYDSALSQLDSRFDLSADQAARAIKARLLLARANTYRALKRPEQAESDYAEAAAIIPDDPIIPFNRGLLALERGDLESAVNLCREALAAASDTLQTNMRQTLKDPRYQALVARLDL
jgi:tetratricopeptide (TPR) repeat protein